MNEFISITIISIAIIGIMVASIKYGLIGFLYSTALIVLISAIYFKIKAEYMNKEKISENLTPQQYELKIKQQDSLINTFVERILVLEKNLPDSSKTIKIAK